MRTNWFIAFALLIETAGLPVSGQDQPEKHYAITPRLVARALSNNGMQTADEQVSLPAQVTANEPYPALDILSVEPVADTVSGAITESRSSVKLACHSAGSCLPFFAMVAGRLVPGAPENAAVVVARPGVTIRAGEHAVLVMDDHVAHIQVAVVSLENGVTGKWIRVASPDHKQTYLGEVVSAHQLRGNF